MRAHQVNEQVYAMLSASGRVVLTCTEDEATKVADDIEYVMRMAPAHSPGASARQRMQALVTALRAGALAPAMAEVAYTVDAAINDPQEKTEFDVTLPATGAAKVVSPKLAGVIPDAHIEWAVRVYKVDSFGKPSENESVAKTFKKEERAKAALFFERTQNVHNARVRNHESPAYLVVFGMQDDRKHKKAGSFQLLERALCKG